MEENVSIILSVFVLLTISSGVYFLSKRVRVPYTVMLVAIGLLLVPISEIPLFSFFRSFNLTPELLFYVFLPILIFESAYNINIRRVAENAVPVAMLAIVGLLTSIAIIGGLLYFMFGAFNFAVPLIITLIFGALISATDPVAVLSLFKEYGAPRRLSLIFEGESLFNDGTAMAVFLILLSIAEVGFEGFSSVLEGVFLFLSMVIGGVVFGLISGGVFAKLIEKTRSSQSVSIALTIAMAHLTFIGTEIISEYLVIFGQEIRLSAIISTTVAALVMGNYGKYKLPARAEDFIDKFWYQSAFLANSLVFLLIGLLFSTLPISFSSLILPVAGAVLIVFVARAISIYPTIGLVNKMGLSEKIPMSWQHLLAWGSLRGALAITLVLLIPENFTVPGWNHAISPRDFILALTIGCIYASLFIKATTIGPFMRWKKINQLTSMEQIAYEESKMLIHLHALKRLDRFREKQYMDEATYTKLKNEQEEKMKKSEDVLSQFDHVKDEEGHLDRLLLIYSLGVEKKFLHDLFVFEEIDEKTYKRIIAKLTRQTERAERNEKLPDGLNQNEASYDWKDIFENLARKLSHTFFPKTREETVESRYRYYRALVIISKKAVRELQKLRAEYDIDLLDETRVSKLVDRYESIAENTKKRMDDLRNENPDVVSKLNETFGRRGLFKNEERLLKDLYRKKMLTPKLYITLENQLQEEADIRYY